MADPVVRQIKTPVVKQLVREKVMHEKEAKQQEGKKKMRAEDGENDAIKKQMLESEKDLGEAEEYKEHLVLDSVKLEV
ncbi:eukaryotic translation initiation factor 4E isoform X4 [Nomascus leucogenys]|uniref:Eukaryotic translation initiation factor 4E n=1 Tax=Nomascus leucogenys TaxID=61853 RepID=A0A2I3HHW1_NOMLE|nr:eukaryotic translation initiation factor 4E isoform X4 [Nomascus leucogenys]